MPQFEFPSGPDADDFDIAFESPPRRQARPSSSNKGRSSAPARQNSRARAATEPPRVVVRPSSRSSSVLIFDDESEPQPAPRRKTARKKRAVTKAPKSPRRLRTVHYEIAGVLLLAFGGLLFYYALQNAVDGALPRLILAGLRIATGIGATLIPLVLALLGVTLLWKRGHANLRSFWRGAGVAVLVVLTAKALTVPRGQEFLDLAMLQSHGGYIGAGVAYVLRRALGELGATVTLVALGVVALLLWTESSLGELGDDARGKLSDWARAAREKIGQHKDDWKAERRAKKDEQREQEAQEDEDEEDDWEASEPKPRARTPRPAPLRLVRDEDDAKRRASPFFPVDDLLEGARTPFDAPDETDQNAQRELDFEPQTPGEEPSGASPEATQPSGPRVEILDSAPPISVLDDAPALDLKAVVAGENADRDLTPSEALEAQAQASATETEPELPRIVRVSKPRRSFGDGPLMPEYFDDGVRALDPPLVPDNAGAEEEIQAGVQGVQETLAAFKIDARVTDVKRGPVITRYEVQPGAGVRVASIANLDKDLARALSALAVRIEAPVPGKNVVGIEIPNKKVHLVRMRDVLEQPDFLAHQSKLAFVLGKDIAGQPKWGDLTKMPHMLIAGATNSGKSVCLNSIIASILVRARPDEVRFSLIDPKRVELTLYAGIRHLMHDVVVEPKQAVIALRRAIEEMDRRYKLFAARGVRNLVSYNAKLKEGEKPLPYIVIVIDELADLMMTAAAEFEKLICRLAQLARATGIHLIVATQRPSVNVITGVIKANIPARIAFAVASQVDSRTILDSVGAERLIGSGDMLYDSNNGGKSTRIQGAFLSEEEVNRIVEVVKAAYQYDDDDEFDDLPEFDLFVPDDDEDEWADSPADEKRDVLYDEILEFVKRHQEMSASNIQRKFGIGYPRAGRIVDQLERHGILGPADGPKPRKVLAQSREEE